MKKFSAVSLSPPADESKTAENGLVLMPAVCMLQYPSSLKTFLEHSFGAYKVLNVYGIVTKTA